MLPPAPPLDAFLIGQLVWARARPADPFWPARPAPGSRRLRSSPPPLQGLLVDPTDPVEVPENVRAAAQKSSLLVEYLGGSTLMKARVARSAAAGVRRAQRPSAAQGRAKDYAWVRAGQLYPFEEVRAVMEARSFICIARVAHGAARGAHAAAQAQDVKYALRAQFAEAVQEARRSFRSSALLSLLQRLPTAPASRAAPRPPTRRASPTTLTLTIRLLTSLARASPTTPARRRPARSAAPAPRRCCPRASPPPPPP